MKDGNRRTQKNDGKTENAKMREEDKKSKRRKTENRKKENT